MLLLSVSKPTRVIVAWTVTCINTLGIFRIVFLDQNHHCIQFISWLESSGDSDRNMFRIRIIFRTRKWVYFKLSDRNHHQIILLFLGLWFHILSWLESSVNFRIIICIGPKSLSVLFRIGIYIYFRSRSLSGVNTLFQRNDCVMKCLYLVLLIRGTSTLVYWTTSLFHFQIQEKRCWLVIYMINE